ncbi:MAG: hypothetical protein AB7O73_06800 [Bacteroidia bacterium]
MAIWQYTFYVLPKEAVTDITPSLVFLKDDDGFDDSPYWKYVAVEPSFFEPVKEFLPLGNSWSKDLILYGDVDSNCLEVFLEESKLVESVSIRIDFRSNYEALLDKLLLFLMKNNMMVLGEDLNPVKLNEYDFNMKIKGSEQYSKYSMIARAINNDKNI